MSDVGPEMQETQGSSGCFLAFLNPEPMKQTAAHWVEMSQLPCQQCRRKIPLEQNCLWGRKSRTEGSKRYFVCKFTSLSKQVPLQVGSCHCIVKAIWLEKERERKKRKLTQTEFVEEKTRQRQTHNREKGTKRPKILLDRQLVASRDIHQDSRTFAPGKCPEDPLIAPQGTVLPCNVENCYHFLMEIEPGQNLIAEAE